MYSLQLHRSHRLLSTLYRCSRLIVSETINSRSHTIHHLRRFAMSATPVVVNQLINEESPYLLQHAHNPVNWYPWNEDALNKARNENKLIFLSVGYSTCHWCHVMERESFENESIAAIMNEHYINIKVDREERPDIDKTYMTFVQLTMGNGGWPMSVFLTPDLYPVAGGTYFPPEDQWGRAGFRTILQKIAKQWKDNPADLIQMGNKVIEAIRKVSTFDLSIVSALTGEAVPDGSECFKLCLHQFSRQYDDEFGGFDIAPKFPQPSNLLFLFHYYSRDRNSAQSKSALSMALKTLEMMYKGGIHDHVGQGFARYSTDEKWHVPHFEKMLYDQAQLTMAYATAFLITKKPLFAEVVNDILTYVGHDLSHKEGGFYSAEDADSLPDSNCSSKREGAFYVWKFEEIEQLLARPLPENENVLLCDVFNHHYNVKKNGNVDPRNDPHGELIDQNVLIVFGSEEKTAEKFGLTVDCLNRELKSAREILFSERNKRPRPHLDTKIITSWNGLMLSGYSKAAQALQNEEYKARATKAANFIQTYLWQADTKELLHCCYASEDKQSVVQIAQPIHAFLNDYVFLIRGLLDLYEATFESRWIVWSEQLQNVQDNLFWDAAGKSYNLASAVNHSSILTLKDDQDGAEPAGNSVAVQNLLRLSAFLERDGYSERAKQILSAFTSRLTRFPASLPEMTSSLMFYYDAAAQIVIIDDAECRAAKEMIPIVHEYYIPNRVLAVVGASDENPLLCQRSDTIRNMKAASTKKLTAHVCCNRVCLPPVTGVDELRALLTQKFGSSEV